jgi:ssDNA-binding replication factor A large subunit
MKISELKAGSNDVSIKAEVTEVTEPRTVNTKYGTNTVANAILDDGSGTVKLTLWGKQISMVKQGDNVEITGGFVKEWNGELQLGVGKTGEIKVL